MFFNKIGRGIRHDCKDRKSNDKIIENVSSIVKQLPKDNQDQIMTKVLRTRLDEKNHVLPADNSIKNLTLKNSRGPRTRLILNSTNIRKNIEFSAEKLDNFQVSFTR